MKIHWINKERKALTIWQQNANKSPTCQHGIISSGKLTDYNIDIVTLQEPSVNFLNKTIASRDWVPIYPSTHDKHPDKTRSITLVWGDLLMESWEQLDFPSGDVTVLHIKDSWGMLTLFNIYNDCEHNDTLKELMSYHRSHAHQITGSELTQEEHHLIWLGNFNCHHPYWDNPEDNRLFSCDALESVEMLLRCVADIGMDMALPSGTPTHIHNVLKKWTRLDNVFTTEHTLDTISICDTFPEEQGPNMDHIPIITVLDMEISKAPLKKFRNFKDVDWESFNNTLKGNLAHLGLPSHIQSQSFLTHECNNLTKAIQDAIKSEVPISDINAKSKRWWSKELRNLHRESNKLGRTVYNYRRWPEHHIHENLLAACKKYSNSIQYVKQHHWRDWLEKATDLDIWTAHKYISAPASDGGKTRIPNLTIMQVAGTHLTNSNTDKSAALANCDIIVSFLCLSLF